MSQGEPTVCFDAGLNLELAARVFAAAGRAHICPIFDAAVAERVERCLVREVPWQLHLNQDDKSFDIAEEEIEAMGQSEQALLWDAVHQQAATGFQYLFNNFPISDLYAEDKYRDLYVMRVHEFLNAPEFLEFAKQLTGNLRIVRADAQATLYRPGHFLTSHDDEAEGKSRAAAYVLNFTRSWRTDWGGLLNFIDADGHVAEAYTPTFNALNIFQVPQPHAVSYVAPFARGGRYSITGWLRED